MKKITYKTEIIESLISLGGEASLKEIFKTIEKRNCLPYIHSNKNWENNVKTEIYTYCKDMKSFKRKENLFYSVYGKGEGYFGLQSFKKNNNKNISPIIQRQIQAVNDSNLTCTEKDMIILSRIGQGIFRDRIIEKYQKCIITDISDTRLLIASHILPWRSASNKERLSAENGLLLSPLYDKLFDLGLISFSEDMKIIVSKDISDYNVSKIELDTNKIYLPSPSQELQSNMQYHRTKIFKG